MPLQVQFTDASTAQAAATYSYNFGGGTQIGGSNESPLVEFPASGSYTVQLTVTDGALSDSITKTVVVP